MESEGFSISIDRALGTCAGASALQLGITVAAIVPTVDVCDAVSLRDEGTTGLRLWYGISIKCLAKFDLNLFAPRIEGLNFTEPKYTKIIFP